MNLKRCVRPWQSSHTYSNWLFTLITLFHKAHAEFTTGSDAQVSGLYRDLLQDGFMLMSRSSFTEFHTDCSEPNLIRKAVWTWPERWCNSRSPSDFEETLNALVSWKGAKVLCQTVWRKITFGVMISRQIKTMKVLAEIPQPLFRYPKFALLWGRWVTLSPLTRSFNHSFVLLPTTHTASALFIVCVEFNWDLLTLCSASVASLDATLR